LAEATSSADPVTDDRPVQEYDVRSLLNYSRVVPGSVMALDRLGEWCPRCYANGAPAPVVSGLDTYMTLLGIAYSATPGEVARARELAEQQPRVLADSAYLGMIVPESAATYNALGIGWAAQGRIDEAMGEFMKALALDPDNASTHWHLGAGYASQNRRQEALEHLQRSVQLDPANGLAQQDLGVLLADAGRWDEAEVHLENARELDPDSDEVRRNLAAVREQVSRSRARGASRP
jgi:Flp pilus assembly protein TadD